MKNKLWLLQLPFILVFTFCFYVAQMGVNGQITNKTLRDHLFPSLRRISAVFTDMKFRLRGPEKPKHKIVIVGIDGDSLEQIGRWPWHRNAMGLLINQTFKAGAKTVGLDMVFSERDVRIPDELQKVLEMKHLGSLKQMFETDPVLGAEIQAHSDRLVLGWIPEANCQPLYEGRKDCPVENKEVIAQLPKNFDKFAFEQQQPASFDLMRTPLISSWKVAANLPEYNAVAQHSGFFLASPDPDGVIRRAPMLVMVNGKAYPSLPLEIAKTALHETLDLKLDHGLRVRKLAFGMSGQRIPTTPVGAVEINFRGPGRTFPYLSALDVMRYDPASVEEHDGRALASAGSEDKVSAAVRNTLKDAIVLIGITAAGSNDIRAIPFDSYIPGVEGHASILDNILSNDFLTQGHGWNDTRWLYLLMIGGGLLFAYFTQKLEAIPALLLTMISFGGFGIFDVKVLFERNHVNWDTSFLFIEFASIFIVTMAAKYVIEERNKKFVRGAFAKYVAPAVVESILKDPAKLTVGGEKRDLTILFSDIRGFTSFSEKMDPKALSSFLNDYLGIMTGIVFSQEGTLDKYIGDAIMAFWGAPLEQPVHAANACQAAIRMMRALADNRARFREQYGVNVDIGIGINTGIVSVGNMGSSNNFAYTVIGDHVNLASRLEGLTKYYGASIVTTRFTFDAISATGGEVPPHRVLDFVKVKNKKNAVELIQVLDQEISSEGLRLFEEARLFYQNQKWDEAIELFKRANDLIVGGDGKLGEVDGPCRMYIERCEEFKKCSPGPDWDGSWEMQTK